MHLAAFLPTVASLTALAFATDQVIIKNHLNSTIYATQVDASGARSATLPIAAYSTFSLEQSDARGVAIKITPGILDLDIAGKGVLTVGYNKHPDGWIYYDLGVHNYFPFEGARTKLGGPAGDDDWSDGQGHEHHTVGYQGHGDLYLDIGY